MISISTLRSLNQHLLPGGQTSAHDVVHHMGMIQAQDYLGALWAVGVRMGNSSEVQVEQALADRSIVRTWPARGTLHFVAADDIRWMLDLLTPRVLTATRGRYKQLELSDSDFSKSRDLLSNALQGGRQLTRAELYRVLEQGGVSPTGQRGIHILGYLAREGLICFGLRNGKQPTFVLLDEWLPPSRSISKDEALSVLAERYISSHGPATASDFAWWSGLTVTQARAGLESARNMLVEETFEGVDYWLPQNPSVDPGDPLPVTLLPPFDEYLVGYTDRSAVLDTKDVLHINAGGGMLNSVILADGKVVGTWKRTLKANAVMITPAWFSPPIKQIKEGFELAAWQYAAFLGLKAEINPSQEFQTHPV